ncbi:MAG TPA: hypothetical protein VFG66_13990 [Gemmatimonadales bacterium]|nr:hypothetical protein [Gemmatimonadales bacterium]
MIPSRIRYLVLCAALAACGRDKPPKMASMNEALPNIPFPPDPTIVGRAGGPDALQLTVRSAVQVDKVAEYYRGLFKTGGWRLVNDARDADGAIVLLAQQHGSPLWVRIRDAGGGQGALVELTGAVVEHADSAVKAVKPTS